MRPLGTPESVYLLVTALFGATADSVYLSPAPLYHAAPLRFCMAFHRVGATVVVMERFDAEEALAAHRASPGHPQPVGAHDVHPHAEAARRGAPALRHCRRCRSPSTPPRPAPCGVKQQMIEWWGPVLHEYYAGTEGNGFVYCDSDRLARPPRHGRLGDHGHHPHRRRRRRGGADRPSRAPSTSAAAPSSATTTTPRRPRRHAIPRGGAGRPSATSGTSTTTASST